MGRLTVRLPDTLQRQLTDMADREGVPLNQYVVYALTRQAALAYAVHPLSTEEGGQQQASFTALLEDLGRATFEEIEAAMAERETSSREPELTPSAMERLRDRVARKSARSEGELARL